MMVEILVDSIKRYWIYPLIHYMMVKFIIILLVTQILQYFRDMQPHKSVFYIVSFNISNICEDMAGLSVVCLSVCMTVCQSVYHLSVGRVGLTVTSVLSAAINLVMYSYLLYFCFPFRKDLALKYFLTRNRWCPPKRFGTTLNHHAPSYFYRALEAIVLLSKSGMYY